MRANKKHGDIIKVAKRTGSGYLSTKRQMKGESKLKADVFIQFVKILNTRKSIKLKEIYKLFENYDRESN
jgi:hypothetical protein